MTAHLHADGMLLISGNRREFHRFTDLPEDPLPYSAQLHRDLESHPLFAPGQGKKPEAAAPAAAVPAPRRCAPTRSPARSDSECNPRQRAGQSGRPSPAVRLPQIHAVASMFERGIHLPALDLNRA